MVAKREQYNRKSKGEEGRGRVLWGRDSKEEEEDGMGD
jgi:hypothetical protein